MKNLVLLCASLFFLVLSCEKDTINSHEIQNSGIPLIVAEMYGKDLGLQYTYNKWNLPDEVRSKWSYQKFYYDDRNRIIRYEIYDDPGIYSSNSDIADAAMHRTTWVSPENSLKSLIVKYEYTDNTLSQRIYMPQSRYASHFPSYYYTLDDSGRIVRETFEGGFVEFTYDEAGNLKERRQYHNGKLTALKTYTFDNHPNPFIVFKCTAIPGRYTNANNILTESQTTYNQEGQVDAEWTETYEYNYNLHGYPVQVNDMVTYEYR